jgi:NADH:ubiquinone oxidoreductase subunit F (NADH-binding)
MGRTILEGNPHKVIEGMAIAAYAIGATKAFLFVRKEYGLAVETMTKALQQAKEYGLLGSDILGSGFDLHIAIRVSPGAFVCGEETALISSLEGRRGMPRTKPPYPAEQGLFGCPTVVNNLETLAVVPTIVSGVLLKSGENNPSLSPATKVVALSGKTVNHGIAEIPLGISLREIIYGIGGGIRGEKALKAIHLSGPTGYSLGVENLDLHYDYDSLRAAGASIGSGGITLLDESDCMLDLAKYFMNYLVRESCGKCIPCREGTARMAEILEDITRRPRQESGHETLERFKGVMQLEDLASVIRDTSLCGLGRNAPNAILSSLRLFKEEYEEHIFERNCKAGVCTHLRTYTIDIGKCTGCALCARKCPEAAIIGTPNFPHFIVEEKCTGCGICFDTCKFVAINIL